MPRPTFLLAICATLLFLNILPSSASAGLPYYWWSLSSSSTDPFVNTGSPSGGLTYLYLWHVSSNHEGLDTADFTLDRTPILVEARGDFGIETSDMQSLTVSGSGCPVGPEVAARLLFLDPVGLSVCFDLSGQVPNCYKTCEESAPHYRNSITGYSSDGSSPCYSENWGSECLTTPTSAADPFAESTWGRIKNGYR